MEERSRLLMRVLLLICDVSQTKKIDRKKFPELRSRADGALENLAAFVEYRRGIR